LDGGFVTYTPEQKCLALKLNEGLINKFGTVSTEVATTACGRLSFNSNPSGGNYGSARAELQTAMVARRLRPRRGYPLAEEEEQLHAQAESGASRSEDVPIMPRVNETKRLLKKNPALGPGFTRIIRVGGVFPDLDFSDRRLDQVGLDRLDHHRRLDPVGLDRLDHRRRLDPVGLDRLDHRRRLDQVGLDRLDRLGHLVLRLQDYLVHRPGRCGHALVD
jgi:hypothetical protein